MKKLTDMVSLKGKTETITAVELRQSPGEMLVQASLGKVFTITKAGKPIAQLGPIKKTRRKK